ncbi:MAG: hypothetical protein ACK5Z0_07855, partial [Planctomycetota bacterium]
MTLIDAQLAVRSLTKSTAGLQKLSGLTVLCSFLLFSSELAVAQGPSLHPLKWEFRPLAVDANEGIDLADLNRDGKLDVVSGRKWYAAPEFAARPLRKIDDWNG